MAAGAHHDAGCAAAARAVCVVEDDEWVRDSIMALLEAYRFCVTGYRSGAQFLADAARRRIGCLIIDQHMPGLDGLDVVAALRRDGRLPPTILITGQPNAAIARRADELGICSVLQKPFRMGQLVALVDSVLGEQG